VLVVKLVSKLLDSVNLKLLQISIKLFQHVLIEDRSEADLRDLRENCRRGFVLVVHCPQRCDLSTPKLNPRVHRIAGHLTLTHV